MLAAWAVFSEVLPKFMPEFSPQIYAVSQDEGWIDSAGHYEIPANIIPQQDASVRTIPLERTIPPWMLELQKNNPYLAEFVAAADTYNVPLLLLLAICDQESGRKPWALNIAGKTYLPDSLDSALRLLESNFKPSYDVGLMQINSYWIRRLRLRTEYVFEPKVNIHIAAYILDECFR